VYADHCGRETTIHTTVTQPTHLPVLVGVSDIARLTGQSNPSVVTNWRSRSATFPTDRTAGTQPRFDLGEVIRWIEQDGPRGAQVPEIPPATWWAMLVRAFHAQLRANGPERRSSARDEARATLAALVALRHLSPRWLELAAAIGSTRNDGEQIRRLLADAASEVEASHPAAAGLLVSALDVDLVIALYLGDLVGALRHPDVGSSASLLDTALDADLEPRSQPARRTAGGLGELMATLASPPDGAVVFDPACGEGSLLLACAEAARGAVRLQGQERDVSPRQIAATRLLLAGHDPAGLVAGHDSLRHDQFPGLRADVVVLDPPLTGGAAPVTAWIEHARAHLAPGGRAVVALPLSALVPVGAARRRPDERLREHFAHIMFTNALHTAVVVPRGQRPDVTGPIVVLVLTSVHAPSDGGARTSVPVILVKPNRDPHSLESAAREIGEYLETGSFVNQSSQDSSHLEIVRVASFGEALIQLGKSGQSAEQALRASKSARTGASRRASDPRKLHSPPPGEELRDRQADQEGHDDELRQAVRDLLQLIDALRSHMGEAAYNSLAPQIARLHHRL
jgi:hypothetical protein